MASYPYEKKSYLISEVKWSFAGIMISLMTVILLSLRAYNDYHANGIILIGTLYILYGYLNTIGTTFFNIANIYGRIVNYDAELRNAKEIDSAYENFEQQKGGKLPLDWKEIELKGLDFTYNVAGKRNHLEDLDIKFKRGEKIALVGESGSGKSTVLALMRGLYEPAKGKAYCDGKLIGKGTRGFRENVTLIPQDPEIFNNTIKYNVTMDIPYKKDEVTEAIRLAQFEKVIQRLEKGLNTNVLEKGVSLSGGEKQRLALARGLLAAKDSDIVLLDEPTSSVDSLNELKIHEEVFKKFKNKTIISSIHRLHLLEKFDYIYFFDRGKIITNGTLKELLQNPSFKRIWDKYNTSSKK